MLFSENILFPLKFSNLLKKKLEDKKKIVKVYFWKQRNN